MSCEQPRTHKGATREANTTATQNSAPLSTGLSMMFETLTIYPGHLKGLHDHTSRLCFQKIQSWLNITSWGAPNATPWPYRKQLHSYFKQRTDTNRQINKGLVTEEKNIGKQQIDQQKKQTINQNATKNQSKINQKSTKNHPKITLGEVSEEP